MIESVPVHLLIGLIAGAIAGLISARIFKSTSMGTFWNLVMGAVGGICMANILFAYGFDDHNHWLGSLIFALIGGAASQIFFGKIRHGLRVFWLVLSGKQDELGKDPYRA